MYQGAIDWLWGSDSSLVRDWVGRRWEGMEKTTEGRKGKIRRDKAGYVAEERREDYSWRWWQDQESILGDDG